MKRRTHCHHQLKSMRHRGQRCGGRPRVERRLFWALDIVQVEFSNQRKVKADLFTTARQPAYVSPTGLHLFIFHVAQPSAENRKPISVSHYAASFSRKSTNRTNGSKPTTFGPSATKLESALMS